MIKIILKIAIHMKFIMGGYYANSVISNII